MKAAEWEMKRRGGVFEFSIRGINCSHPGETEMDEKTEKQ